MIEVQRQLEQVMVREQLVKPPKMVLRNCNQLIWLFTSSSIRLLKQKLLKEDQINWLQFLML